jgi:hypothetical protein
MEMYARIMRDICAHKYHTPVALGSFFIVTISPRIKGKKCTTAHHMMGTSLWQAICDFILHLF